MSTRREARRDVVSRVPIPRLVEGIMRGFDCDGMHVGDLLRGSGVCPDFGC